VQKSNYLNEVAHGSLYVGSAETVAKKIAYAIQSIGAHGFDLKYSNGPMSHSKLMHSIELYGTKVVPMVQELLAKQPVFN
jgi:alkanesulfonate monooxygenase SsuD/methylene tetrahydromethanopterin reductase-like flavin-dependent oxidoreductase (luciferase family)